MITQTKYTQANITPQAALDLLVEGNRRFCEDRMVARDLMKQIEATRSGQWPFATVLGCIDSRVSSELVFDQGIGDIFSARVAGNIVNTDILGSLEYACTIAGAKLVVVKGHSRCGAVMGACDGTRGGNLTPMLAKIHPAIAAAESAFNDSERNSKNAQFVQEVARSNVHMSVEHVRKGSKLLRDLERQGKIMIVGAMYDIATGMMEFGI